MTPVSADIVPLHRPGLARGGDADIVLRIVTVGSAGPAIEARRPGDGARIAAWRGEVARHLLAAPALRPIASSGGEYPCTTACLRRLVLAAAAVEAALEVLVERRDAVLSTAPVHPVADAGFAPEPLARRLARLGVHLDGDQRLVARVLFAHPGEHFTARDVGGLLSAMVPARAHADLAPSLHALAARGLIQAIRVADGPTFFDIDTRPHAHQYDPATGQLHDVR